jgi:hypothetical protein
MSELTGQEKISERNKIFFWGVFFFKKKERDRDKEKEKESGSLIVRKLFVENGCTGHAIINICLCSKQAAHSRAYDGQTVVAQALDADTEVGQGAQADTNGTIRGSAALSLGAHARVLVAAVSGATLTGRCTRGTAGTILTYGPVGTACAARVARARRGTGAVATDLA